MLHVSGTDESPIHLLPGWSHFAAPSGGKRTGAAGEERRKKRRLLGGSIPSSLLLARCRYGSRRARRAGYTFQADVGEEGRNTHLWRHRRPRDPARFLGSPLRLPSRNRPLFMHEIERVRQGQRRNHRHYNHQERRGEGGNQVTEYVAGCREDKSKSKCLDCDSGVFDTSDKLLKNMICYRTESRSLQK